MIPRTFPSTFALNGQQQMVVHFLTSVEGLERWSDYIPVKLEQGGPENSYSGCIDVVAISELTADTQAWKEYIPVYVDDEATDTWTVNNVGYIPYNFALFAEAAMQLDLTNGADLDYRVTFNRTTNATVTGPDGLIAYAEHNLLRFSESFDNAAWVKTNITITANNAVAPDGTLTADLCTGTSAGGQTRVADQNNLFAAGTTYSLSAYFKNSNTDIVSVGLRIDSTFPRATFNLSTQTVDMSGAGTTVTSASIEGVGNDWFRCFVVFNVASLGNTNQLVFAGGNGFVSAIGDNFLIWGAQLEQSSTAREYYPTTVKNLLGFTEHFDNAAWTKTNASISATKVDDIYGEPFAQKLVENTANAVHQVSILPSANLTVGTVYTFSVYAKAAERNWILVFPNFSDNAGAWFDLSTGTIGTRQVNNTSATIESLDNGWYKCSVSGIATNTTSAPTYRVVLDNNNTSYTGDGTSGIFIFGAQLSDSASVDPYVYQPVAAPASTAYYGPRFDYDPVTLAPKGLLIEEQRTNLLLRSEEFDNAAWTKFAVSITANSNIAPDGTLTADSIIADTTNANHQVVNNFTPSVVGQAYTFSFFVKAAGITTIRALTNANWPINATFDLVAKTATLVLGTSASIVEFGNGWFRCSVTGTAAAVVNLTCFVRLTNDSFTGDGFSGIFIWGAQLEEGAFPTSYIPTSASQVTRAADNASMIGNNFARWYNAAEGTFHAQSFSFGDASVRFITFASDATNANRITQFFSAGGNIGLVTANGTTQASMSIGGTGEAKTALAYAADNFAFARNTVINTNLAGIVPVGLSQMQIGAGVTINTTPLNGHISRISYFNRRLANTELQAITG